MHFGSNFAFNIQKERYFVQSIKIKSYLNDNQFEIFTIYNIYAPKQNE